MATDNARSFIALILDKSGNSFWVKTTTIKKRVNTLKTTHFDGGLQIELKFRAKYLFLNLYLYDFEQ